MPIGPARMPLFDHLGELRMRLVRIVVCLLVGVCVFYFATPTMGQFLMIPIAEYLPKGPDGLPSFMAIDPFEAFSTRFKISIWAAIVACSPVILWQLLAFFLPALKPNERKWFIPTFAAAVALFIVGTVFCYCIILEPGRSSGSPTRPWAWAPSRRAWPATWTSSSSSSWASASPSSCRWSFSTWWCSTWCRIRSCAIAGAGIYVGLLVFCAIVTPDASPVTMALMFAALIVLYEVSLLLARIVLAGRIKKQNQEIAKEEGAAQAAAPKTKKLKAVKRK